MPNKTTYLHDYEPPSFQIETVHLAIDLFETHALVKNTMQCQRIASGDLILDGEALILESVHLNGQRLHDTDYQLDDQKLSIKHCPDRFELEIITRTFPQKNTTLSGLYRSNGFFCTQCEAEGFRRITYFLDRPDVLSVYTTRITADRQQYPILLSNGNLIDAGHGDDGRHWSIWHDPFKKPSYLFALVAGDLACVSDQFTTMSQRVIDLRLYVEPGQEAKASHALNALKAAMAWDEREYGREYDLDIYMIVAVRHFNMGAMENKGLNLFNAKYVLATPDTATDQDYADIEGVIAHEYFHNWTGNRVTCRDWFQLSLKEGLTVFRDQEFSRDMNSRDVNRIQDVKTLFQTQFPEDAGTMAHPVRPDAYQEINNFYTATVYQKGAEVIRMMHTVLGKAGFRRGMDLYFERHDGQAVTIEDFVAAMADANDCQLDQFFHWYTQSGTPHVTLVSQSYQAQTLTLTFKQHGVQKPCPIPINIAVFNEQGDPLPLEKHLLLLEKQTQTFHLNNLQEVPAHISLLRDFSAPVILHDGKTQAERLNLLRIETNGFAKWDAANRVVRTRLLDAYVTQNKSVLDEAVVHAFNVVLRDERLDAGLRALLLMPPSFEEVVCDLSEIDVDRIETIRKNYQSALGEALWVELSAMYESLWLAEDHLMVAEAYGRRALRNVCLSLMMSAKPMLASKVCENQFQHAKTMTDQLASFRLLVNHAEASVRQQAIDTFYETWQHESLVLDKWFAIQASADHEDALKSVERLLHHPDFDMANPNQVRAVLGAFSQNNPRQFHRADGKGYALLAQQIMVIDGMNPQISSRLATPFTRWHRFDNVRKTHLKQILRNLSQQNLSTDLRELVDGSLSDEKQPY